MNRKKINLAFGQVGEKNIWRRPNMIITLVITWESKYNL